jgi:hypothetical protein
MAYWDHHYVACSESIWRDFFPREVCRGMKVEGTFMHLHGFFPASRQRQSCAVSVWVNVYTQCTSHCYFLRKWWNDSSIGIASNFARSLAIAKWKPFVRFSGFLVMVLWASHKLRSGTINSKMGARRRAMLVLVGPQQAKMTSSLTKCGLWSRRTVVSPSENLRGRWG